MGSHAVSQDSILVREVQSEDASSWARMRAELWPGGAHEEEIAAFFAGQLHEPSAVLVARLIEQPDELVGFIELSIRHDYVEGSSTSPIAYLEGWYVSPIFRGMRVGSTLLKAAEAWALQKEFTEIASDAELNNHISHAAHEACGFEEKARLVHYIKKLG